MANYRTLEIEVNGTPVTARVCPNCSRRYSPMNGDGESVDLPAKCRRCGSPMDAEKALEWGNERAVDEHDPKLAATGARFRGQKEAVSA